jgi:hypothetical protein
MATVGDAGIARGSMASMAGDAGIARGSMAITAGDVGIARPTAITVGLGRAFTGSRAIAAAGGDAGLGSFTARML